MDEPDLAFPVRVRVVNLIGDVDRNHLYGLIGKRTKVAHRGKILGEGYVSNVRMFHDDIHFEITYMLDKIEDLDIHILEE